MSARVGAPASYLRDLPATLACQNLNYGLANSIKSDTAQLMFHSNGGLLLRAFGQMAELMGSAASEAEGARMKTLLIERGVTDTDDVSDEQFFALIPSSIE